MRHRSDPDLRGGPPPARPRSRRRAGARRRGTASRSRCAPGNGWSRSASCRPGDARLAVRDDRGSISPALMAGRSERIIATAKQPGLPTTLASRMRARAAPGCRRPSGRTAREQGGAGLDVRVASRTTRRGPASRIGSRRCSRGCAGRDRRARIPHADAIGVEKITRSASAPTRSGCASSTTWSQ